MESFLRHVKAKFPNITSYEQELIARGVYSWFYPNLSPAVKRSILTRLKIAFIILRGS